MKGRRNPFFAREGLPWIGLVLLALLVTWRSAGPLPAMMPGVLLLWLLLVFRDPHRQIPASPLGIVSPVDGRVVDIGLSDRGILASEVHRIRLQVDSFGTYTARSPVEGKIMDLRCDLPEGSRSVDPRGLWVRTDESQDVLLQFVGHRFGLAPRAFLGFGERVGQGQRCAYLRLTRYADIEIPLDSRVMVEAGQPVRAGEDLLARLPSR